MKEPWLMWPEIKEFSGKRWVMLETAEKMIMWLIVYGLITTSILLATIYTNFIK